MSKRYERLNDLHKKQATLNSRLVFSQFSAGQELALLYELRALMCPSPSLGRPDARNTASVAVL
jgi:hypothetical protein